MNPYKIISEDDRSVTYEYNSTFTWALYVVLCILLVGMVIENNIIQLAGAVLLFVYFGLKLISGKESSKKIKKALKTGSIQLSGNKNSFKNPLRITVTKST